MPPSLFASLHWRSIGPCRGGRTDAVAGVPGKLAVAYLGTVDDGTFKTIDAGTTWQVVFQHEPVASIGAIAIARSRPDIIYVGTGENTIRTVAAYGDCVDRSDDGGRTWRHVDVTDTRHIGRILDARQRCGPPGGAGLVFRSHRRRSARCCALAPGKSWER